ncbi:MULTISPECIES: hypothetical protein [Stenotrophomonas]|uniref:hypothetical protein n=1 Tax=Stenotrophomonas TaxID=40323 RepID=UPI00201D02E1|nr:MULTISPECIES: hypothetical protein [Stenotrophomonas]MDI9249051.1 hypothetical protein [Stenotrophomonas sp. RS-48]UQY97351.1 hypothetical protein LZ605_08315 [Stenotrophomonas maltophilia]HEL5052595.1 hypothetical protein [Stenotrophomonas maltophilia]
MGISDVELQEMARMISSSMGLKPRAKEGLLRVVGAQGDEHRMSALQRDVLYRRIRDLGNLFWLNWLIRQETMHVHGVMETLSDSELLGLLSKMQRAQECREEGVAFTEIPGLVRPGAEGFQ